MNKIQVRAKTLMIQGTGSGVGKSIMVAALCRILSDLGFKVAPFKSQNMSLNSYITADGGEIGRSQAVQAMAARIEPVRAINPILLKPKEDMVAQVIINGSPYKDISAGDYFQPDENVQSLKEEVILESLEKLSKEFEIILMEGAGSPAEINLRNVDVVNMGTARAVGAPVLLVGDIDKGGVFASLYGTVELLEEQDRSLVKGFIINRFRGDVRILDPGLRELEQRTGIPVLGVVPFIHDLRVEEEDAVPGLSQGNSSPEVEIIVIYLPHISNFTDFDPLAHEPGVLLRYARTAREIGRPDAIIIPGTKNSIADLEHIRRNGMAEKVIALRRSGVPVAGICGGYQMTGKELIDEQGLESSLGSIPGLGFLPVITRFAPGKITHQLKLRSRGKGPFFSTGPMEFSGYEIHAGDSELEKGAVPAFVRVSRSGKPDPGPEGAVSEDGLCFGTYLHDLFHQDSFRRNFINVLRKRKGLEELVCPLINWQELKEQAFNQLADTVGKSLDIKAILKIIA
jgi:adenosylcobyric acid synthase